MKWKTSISRHKDGELSVRGRKLTELIGEQSFSEGVLFVLRGKPAAKKEVALMDALLMTFLEHGVEVPSAFVPRVIVSTGNSMNSALAGGLLGFGDFHGGAIEKAAQYLQSKDEPADIVATALARKERISGFGHKVYKDVDPRSEALFKKASELGVASKFIEKAKTIGVELHKQSGKKLPLNADMAAAAIMSELGLDYRIGKALFALGRMPGMIAHTFEEMTNEKPYRRFEEEDVEYTGS